MGKEFEEHIEKIKPLLAILLGSELKKACPVDTARLRGSIKVTATEKGLLITMVDYGKVVEFGSNPHIIKPKDKKALYWEGADHPVKQVKHPGTRPNPFVRDTLFSKLKNLLAQASEAVK